MSSEKRLILFTVVTFLSILVLQYVMDLAGLTPPPPKPVPPPVAKAAVPAKEAAKSEPEKTAEDEVVAKVKEAKKVEEKKTPAFAVVPADELILGSAKDTSPTGYRLELQLDQKGAGVVSVTSSRYEDEFEEKTRVHSPLRLLRKDPYAPLSLAMTIRDPKLADALQEAPTGALTATPEDGELPLDGVLWEVLPDDQGRFVRPVSKPAGGAEVDGQRCVFRTRLDELGVDLTKTFTLYKGEDAFELTIEFSSPEQTRSLVYKLLGPHGMPIEGEWYTGTFRDAVFGLGVDDVKVVTLSAYDIAKRKGDPERLTKPLRFAGIENQYFTSFLAPDPPPRTEAERWDAETSPLLIHDDVENRQKSDISVEVLSKPVTVGPNLPVTHTYKVFAGAKTVDALAPFGAQELAAYRKSNWIPGASLIAQKVISPLLNVMYDVTKRVAGLFGGTRGNYGVAIILLTMLVRMAMFPLGRKQAMSAKKMQDLQPHMKEIQEKFKDDKEAQTRETWAMYKRHGVNPVGGCLPALIQLPIFVGLWQALNNSVLLRHARFLYIENLAAPDMLFAFPTELPFLGKYFNLLPFLVVALMLVQTKLFSPPATTPEAEMQQKMMKYMMIFMAFMFYKVPSGLGIYFITSSLWQVSERLLLPKVTTAPVAAEDGKLPPGGKDGGGRRPDSTPGGKDGGGRRPEAPVKPQGSFSKFWEKVLAEASKDPTYRKLTDENGKDRDRDKLRARPGRRR